MKRGIGLVLLGFILLLVSGCAEGEKQVYEGVIQDKHFQKGSTSTGMGLSFNGETVVPVMTTNSTSDEYTLFVNNSSYSVSKNQWLQLEKEMTIRYTVGFTGINVIQIVTPPEDETENEEMKNGVEQQVGDVDNDKIEAEVGS